MLLIMALHSNENCQITSKTITVMTKKQDK